MGGTYGCLSPVPHIWYLTLVLQVQTIDTLWVMRRGLHAGHKIPAAWISTASSVRKEEKESVRGERGWGWSWGGVCAITPCRGLRESIVQNTVKYSVSRLE